MINKEINRKIAVILATDVVAYSKHMEQNESDTVKNLRSCEQILKKITRNHNGRIFNSGGDSFFIEFPSAVEAVEAAVEFQLQIKKRNTSGEDIIPLEFRIGINSGDVIEEQDNLLGDGINIAARLEALAQPNGICLSKNVFDYVHNKTEFDYNDLGVQRVKQNQFHAYDLLLDPSQKRILKTQNTKKYLWPLIAATFFVGAISFYFLTRDAVILETNQSSERVSLLIFPLENKSNDEDDTYIATGMVDHLSTTLSNYKELYVFDKSSAKFFGQENLTKSELKDDYGVQFLLEGNMQVSGNRIRISISLLDLIKGTIAWSEVLDFNKEEIFETQDTLSEEVLQRVIGDVLAFDPGASKKRQFTQQVYLNNLKGRLAFETHTLEGVLESERLLKLSRKIEPNNVYLDTNEAWVLMGKVWFGGSEDMETDIQNAYRLTLKTLESDPNSISSLNLATMIERNYIGKLDLACSRIKKVLALASDPTSMSSAANLSRHCGDFEKALRLYKKVYKIAPHFSLWFKKDYAWTFLMSEFSTNTVAFTEAKSFIKAQLQKNFTEDGINEMWLVMLAYIASKEGDDKAVQGYIEKQSEMDNPIDFNWKKSHPPILNEYPEFKANFFNVLDSIGVTKDG